MTVHRDAARSRAVRSRREVQRAHDLLQARLTAADAGMLDLAPVPYAALAGALNLACWLLGHPNPTTDRVLAAVRRDLADAGLDAAPLRAGWRP